jgi:hypothetical protein
VVPLAVGGAAVAALIGFVFGTLAAGNMPVQTAAYSPARGTVAIRFRNPDYAALVVETLRRRGESGA